MQVLDTPESFGKFCQFIATKKKNLDRWAYLHMKIGKVEDGLEINELVEYFSHQFRDDDSMLFKHEKGQELVMVTGKEHFKALSIIDRSVYASFPSDSVRSTTDSLHFRTLESLSRIIKPYAVSNDVVSNIALKRMSRPSNTIMVVDDDPMVLKQMEHMLTGFGSVFTCQTVNRFPQDYIQHAPDILFLDIHLDGVKGFDVMDKLRKTLDPFANIIMISSDTKQSTVLEVAAKKANGFIAKPLNSDQLFQQMMKSPTFVPKRVVSDKR